MKLEQQNYDTGNTLPKCDSIHSNRLYQVTEKNSENQSLILRGSKLHNLSNKASQGHARAHSSQKSMASQQDPSTNQGSVLIAELNRLEKELITRGASPLMKRETTQDRMRRAKRASGSCSPTVARD